MSTLLRSSARTGNRAPRFARTGSREPGPRLLLLAATLFAVACAARQTEGPRRPAPASATAPAPAARPAGLYSAEEALADALSGPLEYVGTGPWPGINRMKACVFRNARVIIVNVYCTRTETPAFRVDVYSPTRGRARVYAESRGTVSAHMRQDYFTFTVESEPPPGPEARIPALTLGMSFLELHNYDAQRHNAYLPACYGGTEHARERGGCLGALEPRAGEWAASHRAFLARANDDWYRLVRELRREAAVHGKEPE